MLGGNITGGVLKADGGGIEVGLDWVKRGWIATGDPRTIGWTDGGRWSEVDKGGGAEEGGIDGGLGWL